MSLFQFEDSEPLQAQLIQSLAAVAVRHLQQHARTEDV